MHEVKYQTFFATVNNVNATLQMPQTPLTFHLQKKEIKVGYKFLQHLQTVAAAQLSDAASVSGKTIYFSSATHHENGVF